MNEYPKLSPGMQVGDYLLKELISEGSATRTWYAQQVSVKREVIVDSLRSAILENDAVREAFLEDVRAKARVDHPLIGSVFEAVRMEDICFYARERLSGETLEALVERGDKLAPTNVVHMLKQIAEANMHLEHVNIGSIPIGPHQIYIGDKFLTRLVNMAIGEVRNHEVSQADKILLGTIFKGVLDSEQPGATRVRSLCDFMTDESREVPITWEQVRDLSAQVEKQLREQPTIPGQERQTLSLTDKELGRNLGIVIGSAVVVLAIVGGLTYYIYSPKETKARNMEHMTPVDVAEVEVGGDEVSLRPFEIDTHEVTIAEYAEFLQAVEKDGLEKYKPKGFPNDIKSVAPKDWAEMYEYAVAGMVWQQREMGLNRPVTQVSYWDAMAYARWKSITSDGESLYRLPTEAHWLATLADQKGAEIGVSDWGVVDADVSDRTVSGVLGMAGNVSEWVDSSELDVDGVTHLQLVLGASYLNKDKGAFARQVVRSRKLKRLDVGFRLIKEMH